MCQSLRWGDVEQQVPGPIKVEVLIGWNRVISQPNEKSRLWCSWKLVKFSSNLPQFTSPSEKQMPTPPPPRPHQTEASLSLPRLKMRTRDASKLLRVLLTAARLIYGSLRYVQPFSIKGSVFLTLHLFTNYKFLSLHQEISRDPSVKDHPSRYKRHGNRRPVKRPDWM